jgi:hypothetical protein
VCKLEVRFSDAYTHSALLTLVFYLLRAYRNTVSIEKESAFYAEFSLSQARKTWNNLFENLGFGSGERIFTTISAV